jgi:hypothetical protein
LALHKIMIIRHAEKAVAGMPGIGVDEWGAADPQSLTVRGWQRSGALTRFFAAPSAPGIERPETIYATGTAAESPSRRSIDTAAPIAAKLGCRFVGRFAKENVDAVIGDAMVQTGAVLIVWEHKMIPSIVRALPNAPDVPALWPPERYDLIWVLDRRGESWSFTQVAQCLLAGDSAHFIVP